MSTGLNQAYWIFEENFDELADTIEKAAKKARKLDLAEPTLSKTGEEKFEDVRYHDGTRATLKMIEVFVTGVTPCLEGWRFAATIQHHVAGNIIRSLNDFEIPTKYRTVEPVCDHCNVKRYRIDTYLVYHKDNNEWAQVGSTCLQDFIGGINPHAAARYAAMLADISDLADSMGDPNRIGTGGKHYYPMVTFLENVAVAIQNFGWRPRSRAYEGLPTANVAMDMMFKYGEWANKETPKPTPEQRQKVAEAVKWAREEVAQRDDLNDYLHNLIVACSEDYMTDREAGLVASLLNAHQREITKQLEAAQKPVSQWVGEIKKREVFKVKCIAVYPVDTQFGVLYIHRFVDEAGNTLIWKTGSYCLDTGVWWEGKATVKEHDTWGDKNEKQTIITRCKFDEVEDANND